MAERRRVWVETRQPDMANMLEMLVFIDETSLKTNLVKTTGWAPVGARLIDHAPFGHWHSQTPACAGAGSSSRALVATVCWRLGCSTAQ